MINFNKKITMGELMAKYTHLTIDNLVQAASQIGVNNIWNKDSYTSIGNAERIMIEANKKYILKANKNNPYSKQYASKSAMVVDYMFTSYVFGEKNVASEIIKNSKIFNITELCIILDDGVYAKYTEQLNKLKEYLRGKNIKIEMKEISKKNTRYSNAPRADLLVAKKLGEYENMKYNIYLLSGDGDFAPVVADIHKSRINLIYVNNSEAKYSYELMQVFKSKKNGNIEEVRTTVMKDNTVNAVLKCY